MIDAMKQALEALEDAETTNDGAERWNRHFAAKEALRQAIAEAEKQYGWVLREVYFEEGEPLAHREPQESTLQEISDIGQEAHTDHPMRHWDRTCPACVAEAEPQRPVKSYTGGYPQYATDDRYTKQENVYTSAERVHEIDILRQSEREGWRYAKECESEIKRLKELAEYRLKLLMKIHGNELDAIERGYFAGKEAGIAECEAIAKLRERNN